MPQQKKKMKNFQKLTNFNSSVSGKPIQDKKIGEVSASFSRRKKHFETSINHFKMALPNIFDKRISENIIQRLNSLKPNTEAKWGKMNVGQMLAHCNVTYEMVFENKFPKPNFSTKLILKWFVKRIVTNETPYKHNSRTAPAFIIKETKDFETERKRLINYINKTQQIGEAGFDNKASHSFGVLNKTEWNNMFYKHLDHHLNQFGV